MVTESFQKTLLARNPAYPKILEAYNEQLRIKGKVNLSAFYREVILPLIPDFKYDNWNHFIKRFKTVTGLPAIQVSMTPEEKTVATTLLSNEEATQRGLQAALNIGMGALAGLLSDPIALAKMPPEKRADLMFKAMKAQDSRVHAIGRMKDDKRAEEKFNRTFNSAAYKRKDVAPIKN